MLHQSFSIPPALVVALLLVSCGGHDPTGDQLLAPGGSGYSGTLVAEGTGNVHTLELETRDPANTDP